MSEQTNKPKKKRKKERREKEIRDSGERKRKKEIQKSGFFFNLKIIKLTLIKGERERERDEEHQKLQLYVSKMFTYIEKNSIYRQTYFEFRFDISS